MTHVTLPPVPGAVEPAPGVGVTYHSSFGTLRGTILRAAREVFWFQVDRDFPGAEKLGETFLRWTNRAILYQGVWRVSHEMRRVEVGFRRVDPRPSSGPETEADRLATLVEAYEPRLLTRRWYPMNYLLIPNVKGTADALLARFAAYEGPERERVAALHARFARLRARFSNLGGGLANAATDDPGA